MLRHLTATPRDGWRDHAACRNTPLDFWYSDNHPIDCLSVCQQCPVRLDCGADAWADEQNSIEFIFGVRAAMAPTTRQRLYRKLGHH